MSNYELARYPQDKYRFQIYDNTGKLSWQKVKARTGCYALINLAYFGLTNFKPEDTIMVDGWWLYKAPWSYCGLLVSQSGGLSVGSQEYASWGYANAEPLYRMGGRDQGAKHFSKNGTTMVGVEADGTVVALLAPKDTPITSAEGVAALAGCKDILRFDGSWSSQGSLGPGMDVDPSQERVVRSYLLVFEREKKEDKPVEKKFKVCLDPGHGVETAGKCAPDKSYYEHEFNLDMAGRLKALLERHGVAVTLTRTDAHDVDLPGRVRIANGIKDLDLFVSLHSNASGDGSKWTSPDGYGIYTSAAGATANRNIAAGKILARVRAAGIKLWDDGLFHSALYVCKNAVAPAVLIEHGFHTNKAETARLKTAAYRQKLAEVDCKGILDYLGVAWVEEAAAPPVKEPWYAEDQKWAVAQGISDGTKPEDTCTRAEVWAMAHNLYKAIKAGK